MATPTVLLLDDDANTLFALHSILERTEANVLQCEDEECALNTCRQLPARIDVLVADVILQYSDGPAVVRKVRPLQPLMRLLFISGFSLTELVRRGLLGDGDLVPGTVEPAEAVYAANLPRRRVETVTRLINPSAEIVFVPVMVHLQWRRSPFPGSFRVTNDPPQG